MATPEHEPAGSSEVKSHFFLSVLSPDAAASATLTVTSVCRVTVETYYLAVSGQVSCHSRD